MFDKQLSDKIKITSFLCTVMVIFRHSLNHTAFFGHWEANSISGFIEGGISTFTEVAVPLFFTISGFFFFNRHYTSWGNYPKMVTKKAKTLMIPFLVWNLVGAFVLLLTHKFIYEDSLIEYFIVLLRSDWYGPLWYIRTLIIFMIAYPIYGWIFRYNSNWLYAFCFIVILYYWIPVDCNWISTEGILFFCVGGFLSQKHVVVKLHISIYIVTIALCLWIILCFIHPFWGRVIWKFNTILGICVFWQMIDYIPQKCRIQLLSIAPFSFFIFVNHFYLLKTMKVTLAYMYPQNEVVALIAYFLLPFVTVITLFYIGKIWYKKHPASFLFVTGGRA